ncbi:MAG: phosphatase PAP2-related protein [Chitinophagales bacterium]
MTIFENRKGTQIMDPFLAKLPVVDASNVIFILTYSALAVFILSNIVNPLRFIKGLQAYSLLLIMRTITIYLVPLEPPIGMIVLKDTVSNFFMNSTDGGYIVKDLFFSGHVSAVMLFFFIAENKFIKTKLLILAFLIGTLILLQHVHYVMDVVAAPFFSYLAIKIVALANRQISMAPVVSEQYSQNN